MEENSVSRSIDSQCRYSSVSKYSNTVDKSPTPSVDKISRITSNALHDLSNTFDLHDDVDKQEIEGEIDGNQEQQKDDNCDHSKETYPIDVGSITWGKTKLGGNMLFMEENIYVFQSKSDKLNKVLWRCQRRDKKCRAVVYTDSINMNYIGNNGVDHNHPTDSLSVKKHRLINDLKRKVEDLTVDVPAAVDQAIANLGLDDEGMVHFPLPKTVGKFFECLARKKYFQVEFCFNCVQFGF